MVWAHRGLETFWVHRAKGGRRRLAVPEIRRSATFASWWHYSAQMRGFIQAWR